MQPGATVPHLHLYGPAGGGKTLLAVDLLSTLGLPFAFVDGHTTMSTRQLLETVVAQMVVLCEQHSIRPAAPNPLLDADADGGDEAGETPLQVIARKAAERNAVSPPVRCERLPDLVHVVERLWSRRPDTVFIVRARRPHTARPHHARPALPRCMRPWPAAAGAGPR